jgi:ABC-type transport system involved in resistance to organic solvents, periplasmic component
MQQHKLELAVGFFILLGIVALAFLALQVSGLSFQDARRQTYKITAEFNNVAGLKERAKVSIAGVTVGQVTAIRLDPLSARAVVEMAIDQQVDYLTTDSIAGIKTSGVLGEQYVSISVGGAPDVLEDGGKITDTQSAVVLEDLIGKFMTTMGGK